MSPIKDLAAPAIIEDRGGPADGGLDRMPRLDLEAHRDIFGPLPGSRQKS